jgi:hypothetical protein
MSAIASILEMVSTPKCGGGNSTDPFWHEPIPTQLYEKM